MVPSVRPCRANSKCDPAIRVYFIEPWQTPLPPDSLTCLFNRPYRNENGSMTMSFVLGWSELNAKTHRAI